MNLFSGLEKFGLEAKESMQLFEEGKRENTKKEKEEEKREEEEEEAILTSRPPQGKHHDLQKMEKKE